MKLQFCGAAKTVTGSCFYMDTGKVKFIVDCGSFQGTKELYNLNYEPFPFNPAELDYVFLTHGHFDHCGRLPLLIKQGFKGRIISTQPTREIARVVLLDAAGLQEEEYRRWTIKAKKRADNPNLESGGKDRFEVREPMYTQEDVNELLTYFDVYPYGDSVDFRNGVEFRMRDAGHILGSAMFELWLENGDGRTRKVVFSGDMGQAGQRIVKDPDLVREADYVIVESTYGNRSHRNKDETLLEFLSILKDAQQKGGNVLIPSFAIERAQEILYELNLFFENRLLTDMPVYLDSPMASETVKIFKQFPNFYDEDAQRLLEKGDDPFDFPGFHETESAEDSKRLVSKRGAIIIAGSGMCTGGRIIHHLENNIESSRTSIVFVGFQVEGTLGRDIVEGAPEVYIKGKNLEVRAQVHTLGGFSAHADQNDLRYWLRGFGHSPRRVFMVHGEESVATQFAQEMKEELSVDTHVPDMFEIVTLE